jgi:hypothetical protein
MNALPSLPLLDRPCLHMKVSVKKETNVYFNHQFRSIRPSRPLSATRSGEAAGSQSAQYSVNRDGILGHKFDKKLESFAPCYSQSFYWQIFVENQTLLWS